MRSRIGFYVFFAVVALFIVGGMIANFALMSQSNAMTCTVTDKDRSTDPEGGSIYQIYTEDCGVLRVQDNPLQGVWNAADIYAQIDVDTRYEFHTSGWRMPLLSQFPVIHQARELTPAP